MKHASFSGLGDLFVKVRFVVGDRFLVNAKYPSVFVAGSGLVMLLVRVVDGKIQDVLARAIETTRHIIVGVGVEATTAVCVTGDPTVIIVPNIWAFLT